MGTEGTSREAARAGRAQRGSRHYNRCAMVLPPAAELEGKCVLDLECRGGLGAFKLAELVGKRGFVIGLDSSPAHIEKAIAHAPEQHWAGARWRDHLHLAVARPDNLRVAGVEGGSVDVAIINSVLNVVPDRAAALREIACVLAPGGYLYLDALLAVEELPTELAARLALAGNAFGAAPTRATLEEALRVAGFSRVACSDVAPIRPEREDADPALAPYAFASAVVQAWV